MTSTAKKSANPSINVCPSNENNDVTVQMVLLQDLNKGGGGRYCHSFLFGRNATATKPFFREHFRHICLKGLSCLQPPQDHTFQDIRRRFADTGLGWMHQRKDRNNEFFYCWDLMISDFILLHSTLIWRRSGVAFTVLPRDDSAVITWTYYFKSCSRLFKWYTWFLFVINIRYLLFRQTSSTKQVGFKNWNC